MPAHARINWEFQAVLRGRLAPLRAERVRLASSRLWLFPPGEAHGWQGEKGRSCEVVVFHFSQVPESVQVLVRRHGYVSVGLKATERLRLRRLMKTLMPHYQRPRLGSDVQAGRVLMELCSLVLRAYPEMQRPLELGPAYVKVMKAEDWARGRAPLPTRVADLARAVACSPGQLDRLFSRIRGGTPREFLVELRMERAMELLSNMKIKLETVAKQCGFSSASNFCRAFKARKGASPTRWRRETLIRYRIPKAGRASEVGEHGRPDRRMQ